MRKGEIFKTALCEAPSIEDRSSSQSGLDVMKENLNSHSVSSRDDLEEGIMSPIKNKKLVKVRAPADLQEGFKFKASFGDRTVIATVVSSLYFLSSYCDLNEVVKYKSNIF